MKISLLSTVASVLLGSALALSAVAAEKVPTPSGTPAADVPMPGHAKRGTPVEPNNLPRSDNETNPQGTVQHSGAAESNEAQPHKPRAPLSDNEATGATRHMGATSGSAESGTQSREHENKMNR